MSEPGPTIMVRGLVKHYKTPGRRLVRALDGVDLEVGPGEVLGIVGESGCGKSTLARLLTALERPTAGMIEIGGSSVADARGRTLWQLRRTIQMVFQDPYGSLDPRQRIGDALREVRTVHRLPSGRDQILELLEQVGLTGPIADRFPHQLSGGQRQRIGIARALAVGPQVLVLDEPVSALDVSVRAEIMNLLVRLRAELGLTYVFISHDLSMVRHLADRIAVMYLGQVVEYGSWRQVSDRALHPYTRALQAAEPVADPELITDSLGEPQFRVVGGEPPDAAQPPPGCRFHPRCPLAEPDCSENVPLLQPAGPTEQDHLLACPVVLRSS
jgi:oligopeptide/dipeptide ABC transporter ATP-binding protein